MLICLRKKKEIKGAEAIRARRFFLVIPDKVKTY